MIDFHCHLDLYEAPHAVAAECAARGMYVLSLTTTPSAWAGTSALADHKPRIRTALGLHPQIAHQRKGELPLFERLLGSADYVGEVGLDGSPELRPHWSDQLGVFEAVLVMSSEAGGRVISIHSRRAAKSVLDQLGRHSQQNVPVLHWFSGTPRELDRAAEQGCWFSVGPAMLRSEKGRALASRMPLDRVLTESDGPFAQVQGRPMWPWEVVDARAPLSQIWRVSEAEVEERLAANLARLGRFGRRGLQGAS